jgi:hypothetical protein
MKNSGTPVAVIQTKREYEDRDVEMALASFRALLPKDLLMLLSFHLTGMNREQMYGRLVVSFNLKAGKVLSADFERKTHWSPAPKE